MRSLKEIFQARGRFLILRRGLVYSVTAVIARLLNLATLSLVLHYAGTEALGKFSYCLSIASTAFIIGAFGMDGLLFREMSLRMRQACAWLVHGMALKCATVFLAMGATIAAASRLHPGIDTLLLAGACALVFGESLIQLGSAWFKARRKPALDFVNTVGRSALVIAGVLLILPWNPTSRGIAAAYGVGVALAAVAVLWAWWKPFRIGWSVRLPLQRILSMVAPFAILDVLGNLVGQLPVLWLGRTASYAEVGEYTVYLKFLAPFALITGHYTQSLQPELARVCQSGQAGLKHYVRNGICMQIALGLGSSCAALVLGPFVLRWLGHQGEINEPLLWINAAFPFIIGMSSLASACAVALNAERKAVWAQTSAILFVLLALTYPLMPPVIWAAFSAHAAVGVQAVVTWVMVARALQNMKSPSPVLP
jgi:O-antigen/teichoic acid export membrane protein